MPGLQEALELWLAAPGAAGHVVEGTLHVERSQVAVEAEGLAALGVEEHHRGVQADLQVAGQTARVGAAAVGCTQFATLAGLRRLAMSNRFSSACIAGRRKASACSSAQALQVGDSKTSASGLPPARRCSDVGSRMR
jgi:hypothetical protein